jgi:hypothetical protein
MGRNLSYGQLPGEENGCNRVTTIVRLTPLIRGVIVFFLSKILYTLNGVFVDFYWNNMLLANEKDADRQELFSV